MGQEKNDERDMANLVGILERHRRRYINEQLRSTGLYGSMFFIMLKLECSPGINQDQLSEHLFIDKTRTARTARSLEKSGYITREIDEDNRRQYKLYLSGKGAELLPEIRRVLTEWHTDISAGISGSDYETALRVLEKMYQNIE